MTHLIKKASAAAILLMSSLFANALTPKYELLPSNAEPLKELSAGVITLKFVDYPLIYCSAATVTIKSDAGRRYGCMVDWSGNTLQIHLKKAITVPGVYTIIFEDATISGEMNCNESDSFDELIIEYQIEGEGTQSITNVTAKFNDGQKKVYKLNGEKVEIGQSELAPGYYVVDGKLQLIK